MKEEEEKEEEEERETREKGHKESNFSTIAVVGRRGGREKDMEGRKEGGKVG